jgi:hypothetical protein
MDDPYESNGDGTGEVGLHRSKSISVSTSVALSRAIDVVACHECAVCDGVPRTAVTGTESLEVHVSA